MALIFNLHLWKILDQLFEAMRILEYPPSPDQSLLLWNDILTIFVCFQLKVYRHWLKLNWNRNWCCQSINTHIQPLSKKSLLVYIPYKANVNGYGRSLVKLGKCVVRRSVKLQICFGESSYSSAFNRKLLRTINLL